MVEASSEVPRLSMANRFGNKTRSSLDEYAKVVNFHKNMEKTKKTYQNFLQVRKKIPQQEPDIPNVVSAASILVSNIKQSLVKAPQVLLDESKSSVDVAERLKRGTAVTGSYAVLNGLFGEKPKENSGNGEYRRVTQTPSLVYNITKHSDYSLKRSYPNFVIQFEKNKIKNRLRRTSEGIQNILRNEQLIYTKGQEINGKQNYLLSNIKNNSADGELGLGNNQNDLEYMTKEKAAILYLKKNKSAYFDPIKERYIRRHELHEPFLWERHVGRTHKTSLLPKPNEKNFAFSNPSVLKHSFEDILNENKPLGKFDNMLKEQRQPIRPERLD